MLIVQGALCGSKRSALRGALALMVSQGTSGTPDSAIIVRASRGLLRQAEEGGEAGP